MGTSDNGLKRARADHVTATGAYAEGRGGTDGQRAVAVRAGA